MEPLNTGDGPAMSESSPPGHCGIFFSDSCFILWIHLAGVYSIRCLDSKICPMIVQAEETFPVF